MEGDNTRRRLLDAHILDYIRGKRLPTSAHVFAREAAVSRVSLWYEGYMDSHWGMESDLWFVSRLEPEKLARCHDSPTWIINEGIRRLSPTSERAIRLDKYILAYLRRRGLTESAAVFALEAQVNDEIIEIEDGLDIFWTSCYEQRLQIQKDVDLELSKRIEQGFVALITIFPSFDFNELQTHSSNSRPSREILRPCATLTI
ncbi:hypothetical protein Tco_0098727 [Tanacetum coccineum]